MALQFLETNIIGPYLIDAWQNELQTESDPTSGKWFRQGPSNSVGLFGGLTDILVKDLSFDVGQANVNRRKELATSTIVDNRSGLLNDAPATTELTWEMSTSASTSQTQSHTVTTAASRSVHAEVGLEGIASVSQDYSWSVEYAYSWQSTNEVTTTETKTASTSVPLKVPQGKVYKLIVLADRGTLTIPYRALIRLRGASEANFDRKINGKTQWRADAGTICQWIKKYGSAKDDAMEFDADPANPTEGLGAIRGTMRAEQSTNFTVFAIDITSTFEADPRSTASVNALLGGRPLPTDQIISSGPIAA